MFGVAGDANLYLIDQLVNAHGVRYLGAAHEAAGVLMALGFARVSGQVGVATTTHGPGFTNIITPLVEGVRSRTPMVIVVGDTDPLDPLHPQNIDQQPFIAATGAGYEPIMSVNEAPEAVARAWWLAQSKSKPVVLNIGIEHQWAEGTYRQWERSWPQAQGLAPDPAALDDAMGVLASARRPVIVAGRGALGAKEELVALSAALGAPLATTVLASNLFRGHRHNLGYFGTLTHPVAAEALATADCVVSFGASMNKYTTDGGRLVREKRLIQCDTNASQLGLNRFADIGVVGDAAATAAAMTAMLSTIDHRPSEFASDDLADALANRRWADEFVDRSTDTTIDPRTLSIAVDQAVPEERTVVTDVGRFMLQGLLMPVPEPRALVTTQGFQSIGLGAGAAVGAGVARPDRPVLLLAGDGGFMMGGLAEFQAAVRANIDLIAVVYNDSSYGAEHIQFHRKGMDPTISMNDWPDLAAVAVALGGEGYTVNRPDDLDGMAKAIANRQRPLLINAHLDPVMLSELMG